MGLRHQLGSLKSSLFPVNRPLLKLKLCYFIVYSGTLKTWEKIVHVYALFLKLFTLLVWFSAYPYVALISAQVVDYTQLAIIYACVPATSIFGPIITGLIALLDYIMDGVIGHVYVYCRVRG